MPPQESGRARALTSLLLVLAILTAVAGSSAHASHGCLVDEDCLACRWATDGVAVASAPPSLPTLDRVGVVVHAAEVQAPPAPQPSPSSRAPPLG